MTIHSLTIRKNFESRQLCKVSLYQEATNCKKPLKYDGYFDVIYLDDGAGFG